MLDLETHVDNNDDSEWGLVAVKRTSDNDVHAVVPMVCLQFRTYAAAMQAAAELNSSNTAGWKIEVSNGMVTA